MVMPAIREEVGGCRCEGLEGVVIGGKCCPREARGSRAPQIGLANSTDHKPSKGGDGGRRGGVDGYGDGGGGDASEVCSGSGEVR